MTHRYPRALRIADLIKEELAGMLHNEIKDPRVQGLVTVMKVEVSADLRHAKIFVSVLGAEEERQMALEGLVQASGFIRRTLGRRIEMKRTPEVHFQIDRSLDHQENIERLLAKARQTGDL